MFWRSRPRLWETLGDARMRRRVARMAAQEMLAWLDNLPNALGANIRVYEMHRAPDALNELRGQLRAAAALVEGLEERARGLNAAGLRRSRGRPGRGGTPPLPR